MLWLEPDSMIRQMITWLQTHNQPEYQLLQYWRKTSKERLHFIHGDETPPLTLICKQWPRYKDKNGHVLVSLCALVFFPFLLLTSHLTVPSKVY